MDAKPFLVIALCIAAILIAGCTGSHDCPGGCQELHGRYQLRARPALPPDKLYQQGLCPVLRADSLHGELRDAA
jgi:hypothetical protein